MALPDAMAEMIPDTLRRRKARLRDTGAASGRLPHLLRAGGPAVLRGVAMACTHPWHYSPVRARSTRVRDERFFSLARGEILSGVSANFGQIVQPISPRQSVITTLRRDWTAVRGG